MEFLELPEEYRELVAPDAPRQVEAVRFELTLGRERREFLAGIWPLSFDEKSGSCGLRMFARGAWRSDLPLIEIPLFSRATRFDDMDDATRKEIVEEGRNCLVRDAPARAFRVDREVQLLVFPTRANFWSESQSMACELGFKGYARGYFDLADSDYERLLQSGLADVEHPVSLSLRWFRSSRDERLAWFGRTEDGDIFQIARVMRNLLTLIFQRYAGIIDEGQKWNWARFPGEWDSKWRFLFREAYDDEIPAAREKWEPFLYLWVEAVRATYEPHFLWKKDNPIYFWYFWMGDEFFVFRFKDAPTSHELLEAPVFLSDWARENAPELADKLLDFPA